MVTLPAFFAVITPFFDTVAIDVLLLFQLFALLPVIFKVWVVPTINVKRVLFK